MNADGQVPVPATVIRLRAAYLHGEYGELDIYTSRRSYATELLRRDVT